MSLSPHVTYYSIIHSTFFVVVVQLLSHVQLFVTLWAIPAFSVHGILQARILEWVAMPFSRESSQPRFQIWIFWISQQVDSLLLSHWGSRPACYFVQKLKVAELSLVSLLYLQTHLPQNLALHLP